MLFVSVILLYAFRYVSMSVTHGGWSAFLFCLQVLRDHDLDRNDVISRNELEAAFKDVSSALSFKRFNYMVTAF